MAATNYGVNAPEAVKLWSKKLAREALKATSVGKFIGRSDNSLIQLREELSKDSGDRVRVTLRQLLTGAGVQGDANLEGNEESLTTFTDDVLINRIANAVRSEGKMSEQRIPFNHREEAMQGLKDWFAQRIDRSFFLQASGYRGTSVTEQGETYAGNDSRYTGNNDTIAPDTASATRADGTAFVSSSAADEDLTSSDPINLEDIDNLVAIAKTKSPMIRPIRYQGEDVYVMFIHPKQLRDLRQDAGAGRWQDINRALLEGGQGAKQNPIFNGAAGMYNNVILHESSRVPQGYDSGSFAPISTVRRAFLCGAQSVGLAFGKGHSFDNYEWFEELFNYGNSLGVSGSCIFGMKKLRFNNADFSTLTYSTYAA